REDRDALALRSDERHGVALIVRKLRSREMPGATEPRWMHDDRHTVFDRFRHHHALNSRVTVASRDLDAEGNQLVPIGDYRRTVNGSQAGDHGHGIAEISLPLAI